MGLLCSSQPGMLLETQISGLTPFSTIIRIVSDMIRLSVKQVRIVAVGVISSSRPGTLRMASG